MPERKINVVIDTNWYISACLNRSSRRILYYEILKNPHIKVFYSKELLQEFEDVISRPKFRKIISYDQAIRFMSLAFLLLNKVTVQSIPQVVRDTDDDYLLGICEHCNADF
ncbi:putative toxin-antitoxin system toxin component, PIN family [Dyadobacter flavalbus]|nr:putative toxin-antitoxin system toxin component, PIN family [Dyadobacter flavalbus]